MCELFPLNTIFIKLYKIKNVGRGRYLIKLNFDVKQHFVML